MTGTADTWRLFRRPETHGPVTLPPGPPWRRFGTRRAPRPPYVMRDRDADIVNTALHLRRPLLVTGYPGAGKSSLAYALADDLGLGDVLHWPVNSRSALTDALYRYDAVGRLRDATAQSNTGEAPLPVQDYVTLGPLGTALAAPAGHPRVLLIDELDKGDIDLPNDLLTVFEDGAFEIPELSRLASASGEARAEVRLTRPAPHRSVGSPAHPGSVEETPPSNSGGLQAKGTVLEGWVYCEEFPVVVITSNGEREFPPAFLRRCVRLFLEDPDEEHLKAVVNAQFGSELGATDEQTTADVEELVSNFSRAAGHGRLATDQLLNAIHLRLSAVPLDTHTLEAVLRPLDDTDAP
ncbi:AAA family ATPase [Streptomyces sp. NPDC020845]|uniref:AAA family ATPase n=1 Tax=Streptomyces sp. NPDC020845 TaxID=3365096 RepID=UPI0037B0EE7E